MIKTLKIAALAAALVVATAGASLAAQYAWVDSNSKVKLFHQNASPTVNTVHAGQKVKVVDSWGNWYKIQIPGKDGWVKAGVLEFDQWDQVDGPFSGQFCIQGKQASFCISH